MGMADYKRFVSYIYNYEFNLKKNNIGYVRVESRNGQCKVTIHIKVLTMNEKVLPVYFFHREGERYHCVWLGNMIPRKGMGDLQIVTTTHSIMNTGYSLEDMGGMIVYASEEKFFGTQWDDIPIVLNEFEIVTERKTDEQLYKEKEKEQILSSDIAESKNNNVDIFVDKHNINVEVEKNVGNKPGSDVENLLVDVDNLVDKEDCVDEELQAAQIPDVHTLSLEIDTEREDEAKAEIIDQIVSEMDNAAETSDVEESKVLNEPIEVTEPEPENQDLSSKTVEQETSEDVEVFDKCVKQKSSKDAKALSMEIEQEVDKEQENPCGERKNIIQMKTVSKDEDRIMKMFIHYPKMYPFEDNEFIECVRIEPQDIGVFPMDVWGLANNSFLLHGYYSYRHLIFAKQKLEDGFQYVMGIPGVYQNREKFMAQMFGFNSFKSVKNREQKTGEFGYWLTPIKCN